MNASKEPIPFAGCFRNDSSPESSLVFVGIPDDSQSSYRVGCADGPKTIRSAYDGRSFNSTTESGVNLEAAITDLGDLVPEETWEASAENYRGRIRGLLRKDQTPFVAGGDHAVTVPVVEAFAEMGAPVHPTHVCPDRRAPRRLSRFRRKPVITRVRGGAIARNGTRRVGDPS